MLLEHCSEPFADAATSVALVARTAGQVASEDLPVVLDGIIEGLQTLKIGLEALVRGLPHEVVVLLDALQSAPRRER